MVAQQTNGLAMASLVLGIVWVFGLGSILAVIFGFSGAATDPTQRRTSER